MFKFRTMERGAELRIAEVVELERLDEPSFKFRNDPRTTRVRPMAETGRASMSCLNS